MFMILKFKTRFYILQVKKECIFLPHKDLTTTMASPSQMTCATVQYASIHKMPA